MQKTSIKLQGKGSCMNKILKFYDAFAGIGGFRAGFERAGGFECAGHCEKDKYADAAYRRVFDVKESEVYHDDATKIDTSTLPEFDVFVAGFPCQPFSIAGRRQGFADTRGTMFFEISRILRAKRPSYFILENVPGLLNHDKGRTFATILHEICDLGYFCEWQVLNSKNFGVGQSRRRVFIVGFLDPRCCGKILPIRSANSKTLVQLVGGRQDSRVYDPEGLAKTLLAKSGGLGGRTGLYFIDLNKNPKITPQARCLKARYDSGISNRKAENSGVLLIKEATKIGYKEAEPGDSVNLSYANQNQKHGRVGKGIANTLDTGSHQGVVTLSGRIRRLVPRECLRLQGFDETQINRLLENSSDAQAYKQAGNAVTVNVVMRSR
jgi:DNA (cytosine-5)-methyltransferase 1